MDSIWNSIRKSSTNFQHQIQISQEIIKIAPYFWSTYEYLRIVNQGDGVGGLQSNSVITIYQKFTEEELLSLQMEYFSRNSLTQIIEGISLAKSKETENRGIILLQSNLKSYSYGLGWLTLAKYYNSKSKLSLTLGAVKQGMSYAKSILDSNQYGITLYK